MPPAMNLHLPKPNPNIPFTTAPPNPASCGHPALTGFVFHVTESTSSFQLLGLRGDSGPALSSSSQRQKGNVCHPISWMRKLRAESSQSKPKVTRLARATQVCESLFQCSSDNTPFFPVYLPDGSYDYIHFPWDFYMQEVTDILDSAPLSLSRAVYVL